MTENGGAAPGAKLKSGNVHKCDIITITSGKGGVGKSTLSTNMAIALQQMDRKVLLIDADIHLGNVDLLLGMRTKYTIADVIQNGLELKEVIVKGPAGIDILPASSASLELLEKEDLVLKKMAGAFSTFSINYDLILIDTGAGIAHTVISFLLGADKIILVITPDPASISDAYAVIKVVRSVNQNIPILLTANMVSSPEEGDVLYKKMNLMVQKFLKSRIIFGGSILRDEIIAKSVKGRQPFILGNPNSASAKALRILNRRLMQVPVVDRQPENNLFDRLAKNKKVDFEWKI